MNNGFESMREKWRTMLTGGMALDLQDSDFTSRIADVDGIARLYWARMNRDEHRTYLWNDLSDPAEPAHIHANYQRLKAMALALATKGSSLANDAELGQDLMDGLEWMHEHSYRADLSPNLTISGKWWYLEIGAPLSLNDIVILLYDRLTGEQRERYMKAIDRYAPYPGKHHGSTREVPVISTGANLVWICTVISVRSIVMEDGDKLKAVWKALAPVFDFVTTGDGFYADGSFIQHKSHPYTGGYGKALLVGLASFLLLFDGTPYEASDSEKATLTRWIYDGFEPLVYKGAMMDMVCGREISRLASQNHEAGHAVISGVLAASMLAPAQDAARLKRMAKYWILADTYKTYTAHASLYLAEYAKRLLEDERIPPRDELIRFKLYAGMDRAVHLREGWGMGISLFSSRVSSYESINRENTKGWYTAHGCTLLYNGDLGQYSDGFWPTVNPYRLPGTTVTTATRRDGEGHRSRNTRDWVGGAELSGMFGIVGMELEDFVLEDGQQLFARKSWFLFGDAVVALGSDIRLDAPVSVETIIDNRRLNDAGDAVFTINGEKMSGEMDVAHTIGEAKWMHLAGSIPGSDIGYYFPAEEPVVKTVRESRKGRWSDIGPGTGSDEQLSRNYLTLWFDHGARPIAAKYAYVLLPGMTAEQVCSYARAPEIEIIEQSAEAHAVREKKLGLVGVHFWTDKRKTVGPITCNRKASVLVRESEKEMELAVADPTQINAGVIQIELQCEAVRVLHADPGVTVTQLAPTVQLSLNVDQARGASFQAKLEKTQSD